MHQQRQKLVLQKIRTQPKLEQTGRVALLLPCQVCRRPASHRKAWGWGWGQGWPRERDKVTNGASGGPATQCASVGTGAVEGRASHSLGLGRTHKASCLSHPLNPAPQPKVTRQTPVPPEALRRRPARDTAEAAGRHVRLWGSRSGGFSLAALPPWGRLLSGRLSLTRSSAGRQEDSARG